MAPLSIQEVGLFGFVLLSRSHPSWNKKAARRLPRMNIQGTAKQWKKVVRPGKPDLQPLIRSASYLFLIAVDPHLTLVLFRLVNLLS